MPRYLCVWLSWAVLLLSSSCGNGGRMASSLQAGGDTLALRHAANLLMVDHGSYLVATLRNPWDTLKTLRTYVLVGRDAPMPDALPAGATVVRTPLERAVVFSSVHCALLGELGAAGAVGGVCDLSYIMLPWVHEGCRAGRIVDAGNAMNPDVERIASLRPDAILLSPYENSGLGRMGQLGVPVVVCADYMETSALGRAEWVRFFGRLVGRAAEADSLFVQVERRYEELARKNWQARPRVFSERKSGSAWYVPAGRSTVGQVYADAGADYVFAYLPGSGSVPLSFETVYDKARDADIWLLKYSGQAELTYAALARDFAPYAGFKAFRERRVYGCNTSERAFYEETPFHPERLLEDLVKIFHPEVQGELRYFRNLAE